MLAWLKEQPLARLPGAVQWSLLLLVSALLVALLEWAHLPAALLLGALLAGILHETAGGHVRVPALPFWFSQAVIGCLIARVFNPHILRTFAGRWPLFVTIMLAVIVSSCALGWLLSRLRLFPETTAIWGLLPGAASVMMLMADEFGADGRLVAFIQYLRVVFVAIAASVIARLGFHAAGHAAAVVWFPAVHWTAFGETLALVLVSLVLGRKLRIPGGSILVPLALGIAVTMTGAFTIELPPWFLALSYALLGWTIGLRFNRDILLHAARTLPQTILAILLLLAFCGGLAVVLVQTAGIDPLTAYLATNPGGMDSVAIIAASSHVDMPFVMSMQASRFLIVLLIGPALSRWVARSFLPAPRPRPH
jgi:membrane AbrB-like protein